jgi:class 3 adenylate cyclase
MGLWQADLTTGLMTRGPTGVRLTNLALAGFWGLWALAVVEALVVLGLLAGMVYWLVRKRTPLLVKQLLVLIPIVLLSMGGISWWVYDTMAKNLKTQVENQLLAWSSLGTQLVKGEDLRTLDPGSHVLGKVVGTEEFARLTKGLSAVTNDNADPWNVYIYDYIYFRRGDQWYVFDQYDYFERYLPRPGFEALLAQGQTKILRYQDAYSQWISSFSPIRSADGTVEGLLEVTRDGNLFSELQANLLSGLLESLLLAMVALSLVSWFSTWWLLTSISSLRHGAARVREGDYSVQVDIQSRDEIEDLGKAFNQMTDRISEQVQTVSRLNQANAKFVPSEVLSFLGKDSILDIRLGDQVQKEMTVLFSDIRSFTALSERMDPAENFAFINSYLRKMGPLIREHGGFIDKYIGDAIMALFPRGASQAVAAALAMSEGIKAFNATNGREPIAIGIGINTGSLMLGIVGEEMRYDGTVISDAVNLASRLESLTKYYGVDIIVSGATLAKLGGAGRFPVPGLRFGQGEVRGGGPPRDRGPGGPVSREEARPPRTGGPGLRSLRPGPVGGSAPAVGTGQGGFAGGKAAGDLPGTDRRPGAPGRPPSWDGVTVLSQK